MEPHMCAAYLAHTPLNHRAELGANAMFLSGMDQSHESLSHVHMSSASAPGRTSCQPSLTEKV